MKLNGFSFEKETFWYFNWQRVQVRKILFRVEISFELQTFHLTFSLVRILRFEPEIFFRFQILTFHSRQKTWKKFSINLILRFYFLLKKKLEFYLHLILSKSNIIFSSWKIDMIIFIFEYSKEIQYFDFYNRLNFIKSQLWKELIRFFCYHLTNSH